MKFKIPAFEIDIVFDWEKDGCDLLLFYTYSGQRSYFGLVCTRSLKYVWDWGDSFNIGASVDDAKSNLTRICAQQVAAQQVVFK